MSGPWGTAVRRLGGVSLACFLMLAMALSAHATAQVQGEILAPGPVLSGVYQAEGQGELRLQSGPGLALTGEGARIVVVEHRLEYDRFHGPGLPSMSLIDGGYEETEHVFEDARFTLRTYEDDFQGLLVATAQEDRLHVGPTHTDAVHLLAFHEPGLVLDTTGAQQTERHDDWIFTYVAPGDRFPVPANGAVVEGSPSLWLQFGEFHVESSSGSQVFTSEDRKETVTPLQDRWIHTYYVVQFTQGRIDVTGPQVAWLQAPTFEVVGELSASRTDGNLVYGGDTHRLDQVPLTMSGEFALSPAPAGDLVPSGFDGVHIGTSSSGGVYEASRIGVEGQQVELMFAGMPVNQGPGLVAPVAATAGILGFLGAAWALTPQGKWVLLGALAPLYAKTQRSRLLENPQRERLMEAIQANPGVHISRLRELAELSWGTTVYHLRLLEKNELVTSVPRAGQRHFFIKTPGVDAARLRRAASAIVGQETAHRVAFAVLNLPGASQKDLAEHLGVSGRVVAHHVGRLQKAELLTKQRDGGFIRCYPTPALGDALAILDTPASPAMTMHTSTETKAEVVQA
jgi:predicted transcriptional regulator